MSSQRFTQQPSQVAVARGGMAVLPVLAASLGLLLSLPGQARAERERNYGSVAITVGTPGGQTTVSRTWGNAPSEEESASCERERAPVVEHRYPQPRPEVVVYHPAPRRVVIVDPPRHYGRPYGGDRGHGRYVVERRHYEPRCDRRGDRHDGRGRDDSRRDRDDHNRHGRRG